MKVFSEFMHLYGPSIIHGIIGIILSYVTIIVKNIYFKISCEHTKAEVVKIVCHAIEEIYPNSNDSDKLNMAINNSKEILLERGIKISDLELRMYIGYTIHAFNVIDSKNTICKKPNQ